MVVPSARILGGIVEQVEQDLLEQNCVQLQHRQAGGKLQFDVMLRQNLASASQRAADDLAEVVQRRVGHHGAGFELGHVEQVDNEAIEPLRFVDDGREQVGSFGIGQRAR